MKRVLVTGATGFIGRNVVPRLRDAGFEVVPVGRADADLLAPAARATLIDETRPTHLLHLAWCAEPGVYWTSAENLRWVTASLDLLERFAAAGGRRAVIAGTCAEYDWSAQRFDERVTRLRPHTLYGACKLALGTIFEAWCRRVGVSGAWGRIFYLYGPAEHPGRLVASVIRSLLDREPIDCSSGRQVKDYLHVEDAAAAFAALLDGDVEGPVNIGSGEGVAVGDLISRIAGRLDARELVRMGARPDRPDDPPRLVAETTRLRQDVGWRPRYTLDEGLACTIKWWQREREPA